MQASDKVLRILQIWESGLGVISLHVFQNVIPVEAYTREACMISSIGEKSHFSRLTKLSLKYKLSYVVFL